MNCWREGGQGKYLKISAENKDEIGQCAALHGVLLTVQYYATKLLVTTCTSHICQARRKLINSGHGIFEQHIRKRISTNFPKTAIHKNLDL